MKMDIRYSTHPQDARHYDTNTQRKNFLVEKVFLQGEIKLTYTHQDRLVFGGIMPLKQGLSLKSGKELGTSYF